MFLRENPVLQRELLVNLRMHRGFILLFLYVGLLGLVVFAAWPSDTRLDLTEGGRTALGQQTGAPGTRLVNLFFLGQYMLMAMMAPSFAAGAITGEKRQAHVINAQLCQKCGICRSECKFDAIRVV